MSAVQDGLEFGAAVCFADIIQKLTEEAGRSKDPEPYSNMAAHIKRIAGIAPLLFVSTLSKSKCASYRDYFSHTEVPNVLEHSGDIIITFDMLSTGLMRWGSLCRCYERSNLYDLWKANLRPCCCSQHRSRQL